MNNTIITILKPDGTAYRAISTPVTWGFDEGVFQVTYAQYAGSSATTTIHTTLPVIVEQN